VTFRLVQRTHHVSVDAVIRRLSSPPVVVFSSIGLGGRLFRASFIERRVAIRPAPFECKWTSFFNPLQSWTGERAAGDACTAAFRISRGGQIGVD